MNATMSRNILPHMFFWLVFGVLLASQDSGYLCILTVSITEKGKLHFCRLHMLFPWNQFQGLYNWAYSQFYCFSENWRLKLICEKFLRFCMKMLPQIALEKRPKWRLHDNIFDKKCLPIIFPVDRFFHVYTTLHAFKNDNIYRLPLISIIISTWLLWPNHVHDCHFAEKNSHDIGLT